MRITKVFMLLLVAMAAAWLSPPVRVAAQTDAVDVACCRAASAECTRFCEASNRGKTCLADCQRMDAGCRSRGTYDWRTRPPTVCKNVAKIPASQARRAFCNEQNARCRGPGCTANPGPGGIKNCQEVECGRRLVNCLETGCYQWNAGPQCHGK